VTNPTSAIIVAETTHTPGAHDAQRFGKLCKSLRRARGLTQEEMAAACGLSADTIRRLEYGQFSPTLDTLAKVCTGLDLWASTLFAAYELGERDEARELLDLITSRQRSADLGVAYRILRAIFDALDHEANGGQAVEPDDDEPVD
jgi:transcriptional regulator with XRE-family HTH domain